MDNFFIQMAASAGHAVAYTIGIKLFYPKEKGFQKNWPNVGATVTLSNVWSTILKVRNRFSIL